MPQVHLGPDLLVPFALDLLSPGVPGVDIREAPLTVGPVPVVLGTSTGTTGQVTLEMRKTTLLPDPARNPPRKRGRVKKSHKPGEYFSPLSLAEAWPSFFSTTDMLMVTAVGLLVDCIPTLTSLPLGGRLCHCIDS